MSHSFIWTTIEAQVNWIGGLIDHEWSVSLGLVYMARFELRKRANTLDRSGSSKPLLTTSDSDMTYEPLYRQ